MRVGRTPSPKIWWRRSRTAWARTLGWRCSEPGLRDQRAVRDHALRSTRRAVIACSPVIPRRCEEQDACADEIVGTLATRAYRRSLSPSEMEERLAYYHAAKKDGFENGIRTAIVGILASPHFLFRTDDVAADSQADSASATESASTAESIHRLNDVELASKLAFFLWSSLPDEELLVLAEAGRLSEPAVLEQQVRRMLADARAETLAVDFAYQWLHLNRMDAIRPDPAKFPQTAGRLDPRPEFVREIGLFVDSVFREDRSVLDLLRAKHTFVNETLAWRYGIEGVRGDHFRRVDLEDSDALGAAREGRAAAGLVLSQSHVARFARRIRHAQHHRCSTEPPPPEVETDLDNVAPEENLTVRERLAIHRENPTCNGCHGLMDPLGFALENFDVDGTWRDVDRESGKPIDASGTLPDGTRSGARRRCVKRYWRAPSSSCRRSSRSCWRTRSGVRPSGTTCRPFASGSRECGRRIFFFRDRAGHRAERSVHYARCRRRRARRAVGSHADGTERTEREGDATWC